MRTLAVDLRLIVTCLLTGVFTPAVLGAGFSGSVLSTADESPIIGAMVTFRFAEPFQERTVFTDEAGHYTVTGVADNTDVLVRVRRIGWQDIRSKVSATEPSASALNFTMNRETDPARVAEQLPANHWYALVLEQLDSEYEREQLVRQCTYCHQQGNAATRLVRSPEEWRKVLALMARMGGGLDAELAAKIPELFNTAYDPENAIPKLTKGFDQPDFAPPPSAEIRKAVIDEFELGGRSSMQHDMIMHPDGYAYSVDMTTDHLFRLDPSVPGGARESYKIPAGSLELGGAVPATTYHKAFQAIVADPAAPAGYTLTAAFTIEEVILYP